MGRCQQFDGGPAFFRKQINTMNLNQVTVASHDLARSVRFYELLGLRLIVDAPPRYARFECPEGDATFSVHLVNSDQDITPSTIVYFETDELDREYERLSKAGVVFDLPPTDQSWRWREARLRDPDGNSVILYHAGEDRKNPPWRI